MFRAPDMSKLFLLFFINAEIPFIHSFRWLFVWGSTFSQTIHSNDSSRESSENFTFETWSVSLLISSRLVSRTLIDAGPNAYCIMEMNHGQRQTTPILWDKSHLQWTIFFRFDIFNMNEDRLKCSIYHRVKYSTDRRWTMLISPWSSHSIQGLLGSIELPIGSLIDRPTIPEDFSSIYSLKSERSTRSHSLQRSFDMLPSSNPCHLLLEYVYQLGD